MMKFATFTLAAMMATTLAAPTFAAQPPADLADENVVITGSNVAGAAEGDILLVDGKMGTVTPEAADLAN